MTKSQTQEETDFAKRTKERMEEYALKICNDFLAKFIKEDTHVFDIHYLIARVKQILKEKIESVDFSNETINDMRRNFLFDTMNDASKKHVKLHKGADEREKRCEPLAQDLVKTVLDPELLYSDQEYIDDVISKDDELFLHILANSYIDMVHEKFLIAIQQNMNTYHKAVTGKEREDITWKDVDTRLKKK